MLHYVVIYVTVLVNKSYSEEMPDGSSDINAAAQRYPALLYEMIRSYTTLARTLNLTRAVEELGITRQTLRRHITGLEEVRGQKLFDVQDRRYELTDAGKDALPTAYDVLARIETWSLGQSTEIDGLQYLAQTDQQGWRFYLKQQPLEKAWNSTSPLMSETIRAWAMSGGHVEHPAMEHIRPHLIVYRETPLGWTCIELGEMSSFVLWFGWAHSRSSIGRPIGELPGGGGFARLLMQPFEEVHSSNGIRLDHIHTLVPRGKDMPPQVATYQRLLLGGRLPDGSFAMLSVAEYTNEIDIPGVDDTMLEDLPQDVILPNDTISPKFMQMFET